MLSGCVPYSMNWSWFGANDAHICLSAWLTAVFPTVVSTLAFAHWRGTALNGAEIALYWIGSAIPVVVTFGNLFYVKWGWLGPSDDDYGYTGLPSGVLVDAVPGVIL